MALVTALILLAVCGGGGDAKSLADQNCEELAATLTDIQRRLEPGESFETQSKATKEAAGLDQRVDELGGCPAEPTLQ